jgi:glutathione gamma-glutamylcysteinyltransferase
MGRELFREALASGGLEGYFALSEQFHTQSEPQYCGASTMAMILNALALDPNRIWKGPWRWFDEEMLMCCAPFIKDMKKQGITYVLLVDELLSFSTQMDCDGLVDFSLGV